ncbi:MAG: hypothetical protein JRI36_09325 [Deltaproteobacteria bacterium]|nr:hypothetical protein [Deltaproteobacteria bacterium]
MKKMLSVLVFCLLLVSPVPSFSADFGPNSADLNGFFPGKSGDRLVSMGCDTGEVFYLDMVGKEEIAGVRCLKINAVTDGTLGTLWMAQDTDGTIWVRQIYFHASGVTYSYGNGINYPFMPANPQVGDRVSQSWPEPERQCRIQEVGVSVDQTCWGMGPYQDCVKIVCGDTPNYDDESEYFCPGVGTVQYYRHGVLLRQLKEVIRNNCPGDLDLDRDVDGADLATMAEQYGHTCPLTVSIADMF